MRNKQKRNKQSYLQIVPSDDGSDNENDPLRQSQPSTNSTTGEEESHKQKSFCQWLIYKPWSKGPFLYFVIAIVAILGDAVFYLMDNDTGFIICGILGISVCAYAIKHFYTLLNLKAAIDNMSDLNVRFRTERNKINIEVDRINVANKHLRDTHHRLMSCNERNRENLDQFKEIQVNMDAFGKESVAEMQDLLIKSKEMENKWHEQLYEHEKNVLHTVFERYERQGSQMGMNQNDFHQFAKQLPDEYALRFERMGTFHNLANQQSLIEYEDFRAALDVYAEMATDNVDIEFEIRKTKSPRARSGANYRTLKNIKFTKGMDSVNEEQSSFNYDMTTPIVEEDSVPKMDPHSKEVGSVDLDDIKFEQSFGNDYGNGANDSAPALYDRKVVVTKKTVLGSRFRLNREDLSFANLDYRSGNGSSSEDDTFGRARRGQ